MSDSSRIDSIELPTDKIFNNLTNAKRFAIDIGEVKTGFSLVIPSHCFV